MLRQQNELSIPWETIRAWSFDLGSPPEPPAPSKRVLDQEVHVTVRNVSKRCSAWRRLINRC
jgi:hypothetical protein